MRESNDSMLMLMNNLTAKCNELVISFVLSLLLFLIIIEEETEVNVQLSLRVRI